MPLVPNKKILFKRFSLKIQRQERRDDLKSRILHPPQNPKGRREDRSQINRPNPDESREHGRKHLNQGNPRIPVDRCRYRNRYCSREETMSDITIPARSFRQQWQGKHHCNGTHVPAVPFMKIVMKLRIGRKKNDMNEKLIIARFTLIQFRES